MSFPILNPYGHVAFQAQRGDVHTVLVDGRVVKEGGKLQGVDLEDIRPQVENTIEHLRSTIGADAWEKGMNPDVPETALVENPYQYTDYRSDAPARARGRLTGQPGRRVAPWATRRPTR